MVVVVAAVVLVLGNRTSTGTIPVNRTPQEAGSAAQALDCIRAQAQLRRLSSRLSCASDRKVLALDLSALSAVAHHRILDLVRSREGGAIGAGQVPLLVVDLSGPSLRQSAPHLGLDIELIASIDMY